MMRLLMALRVTVQVFTTSGAPSSRVSFRNLVHFIGHRRAQPIPSLGRHTHDKGYSNPTKHLHFSLVILLHLDVYSDVAEDGFSLRVYTKETVCGH
ncbi:uncharacterized protein BKA55DRAFT_21462 [Fusarium redolens]|uniref:Secreted protein n=1 Tax=Fusarium redolens TaxID=48865 RepID=A0A9P9R8P5_FUSRE|nr:uncharacterized protein BKA55DRAFT_21462 [Fusarium redolens]KAH7269754.1 hypothetical protein BKA55DRAFT_21462 [Fusarium redolens]